MKFLIDAHLPPGLRAVFQAAGHDAIHTLDLPEQNASRDGVLNEISMAEMRVVVTKDTDFYYSCPTCPANIAPSRPASKNSRHSTPQRGDFDVGLAQAVAELECDPVEDL
jgi:hypothetical protein